LSLEILTLGLKLRAFSRTSEDSRLRIKHPSSSNRRFSTPPSFTIGLKAVSWGAVCIWRATDTTPTPTAITITDAMAKPNLRRLEDCFIAMKSLSMPIYFVYGPYESVPPLPGTRHRTYVITHELVLLKLQKYAWGIGYERLCTRCIPTDSPAAFRSPEPHISFNRSACPSITIESDLRRTNSLLPTDSTEMIW